MLAFFLRELACHAHHFRVLAQRGHAGIEGVAGAFAGQGHVQRRVHVQQAVHPLPACGFGAAAIGPVKVFRCQHRQFAKAAARHGVGQVAARELAHAREQDLYLAIASGLHHLRQILVLARGIAFQLDGVDQKKVDIVDHELLPPNRT